MAVETRSGRTPAKAAAKPAAAGASLAARRSHPAPSASAPSPGAEFGGAAGCALLVVLLPLVCHALVALCHPGGCAPVPLPWLAPPAGPAGGPGRPLSAAGVAAAAGWLAAVAALHVLLPGAAALGAPLRDGTRLAYKLNGAPARARARSALSGPRAFARLTHAPPLSP